MSSVNGFNPNYNPFQVKSFQTTQPYNTSNNNASIFGNSGYNSLSTSNYGIPNVPVFSTSSYSPYGPNSQYGSNTMDVPPTAPTPPGGETTGATSSKGIIRRAKDWIKNNFSLADSLDGKVDGKVDISKVTDEAYKDLSEKIKKTGDKEGAKIVKQIKEFGVLSMCCFGKDIFTESDVDAKIRNEEKGYTMTGEEVLNTMLNNWREFGKDNCLKVKDLNKWLEKNKDNENANPQLVEAVERFIQHFANVDKAKNGKNDTKVSRQDIETLLADPERKNSWENYSPSA